jgi:membrane-associated phospholipid phosphatase
MLRAPWPYKIFLLLVFGLLYTLMYIVPNFHPASVPQGLPISLLEKHIPFMPWTILIYTSDYIFMGLAVILIDERFEFHRFTRQAILVLIFGGTFFWFFPTVLPRVEAPVDDEIFFVRYLINMVQSLDAPTNCFPSLHVGFAGAALWNLRNKSRRVFRTFFFWAVLITLSVLTTKQHYLWDIAGGIGLVIAAVHLDRWMSRNRYFRHWIFIWETTDWWDYSLVPARKPPRRTA